MDSLLSRCHLWFDQVTSSRVGESPQLNLDDLIHIWIYGVEHGKFSICLTGLFFRVHEFGYYVDIDYMELNLIDGCAICCSK